MTSASGCRPRSRTTRRPATVQASPAELTVAAPEVSRAWLDMAARALPDIARDIVGQITTDVPSYVEDPGGVIAQETREAVRIALPMFLRQLAWGVPMEAKVTDVFRRLGRHEALAGRTHDSLQSAYRVASQMVMRQLLVWERDNDVPSDVTAALTSRVFAFIGELAKLSAEGYADARSAEADLTEARQKLVTTLLHRDGFARRQVSELAERARWALPATVSVVEFVHDTEAGCPAPPPEALAAHHGDRCVAVVGGPVDVAALRVSVAQEPGDVVAVVSTVVPLAEAGSAARLAHRLRTRPDVRERATDNVGECDEHLIELVADYARDPLRAIATSRLLPLTGLSPGKRVKYGRLLSAWLEYGTLNADEPGVLDKHRQTLRYQCTQLERMFGEQLHDRTARLELMVALRAALPLWERQAAGKQAGA